MICGLILLLAPTLIYGQRGRGGGVGAMRPSPIPGSGANGSGVGAINPSRRTAVIAAAADGQIRDGTRRDFGRPGYGYQGTHPGLAAAAVARNRVPIGTVITTLPMDCSMAFISEMEYYYCSGQYYQPMGTASDPIYVAAEPYIPEAQIPSAQIPSISIPDIHIPDED
jgi:hypothetical protein